MPGRNPNCRDCGLWKSSKTVCVWGDGPTDASVVLIGEAPGEAEGRTGKPFQGRSGKLLRAELEAAGIQDVYITNLVKCRPPDNRDPTKEEIAACRKYLDYELATIKPRIVVTAGKPATKAILREAKITQVQGKVIKKPALPFTGFPIFHPAYVLRDPGQLPAFRSGLGRLRRLLEGRLGAPQVRVRIVTSKNVRQFIKEFTHAPEFSYDLETSSLRWWDPKETIRVVSIGLPGNIAWVIRGDMPDSPYARNPRALARLVRILQQIQAETGKAASGQNAKFDNNWLMAKCGVRFYLDFDTIMAHHTLDENSPHDLEVMSRAELDAEEYDIPLNEKNGALAWKEFERGNVVAAYASCQKNYAYAGKDACYTLNLASIFRKRILRDRSLRRLFYELVMPAFRAMMDIEQVGLTIDMEARARMRAELVEQRDEKLAALIKVAPINWNAPAQVAKVLYDQLGIECKVLTEKGNPSTGEAALIELKGTHAVADLLISYRELEKYLSTYIDGWDEFIYGDRVYFSYKCHGTVTGRFSSRLHSIPRDGRIRNLGTAPPGWKFWQADLSQAELRIAASISGDLELISCFRPGGPDVHLKTVLHIILVGGGDGIRLVLETVELYCLRHELPPNGTSCQVLQEVWSHSERRNETETLLEKVWSLSKKTRSGQPAKKMQDLRKSLHSDRDAQHLLRVLFGTESTAKPDSTPEEKTRRPIRVGIRRKSKGNQEPHVERRSKSGPTQKVEEGVLRSLWKYVEYRRTSRGRGSIKQPKIELPDALSFLSSLTPQFLQEIKKDWKELRKRLGKATNFGFIYGMYEKKFIETAKIKYGFTPTWEEAHKFRDAYFNLYRNLTSWHDRQKSLCRLDGQVRNLVGRVRRLPGINSSDRELKSEAERQAINSPVQGMIGDWKAAAMVEINDTLPHDRLKLVGEHHDALLGIVREDSLHLLGEVRRIMKSPRILRNLGVKLSVPMESEIEVGNWGAGRTWDDDLKEERK
jgi:uracil-DNA glycosylase family 4